MRLILLLTLLSFSFFSFSQTTFQAEKISPKFSNDKYDLHFKKYGIYEIPTAEIFDLLQSSNEESLFNLKLGKDHNWQLLMIPNDIRSADYRIQTGDGKFLPKGVNKTFKGYEQNLGGEVRLTIDETFFYGYVESGGERYFFEPAWYLDKSAPRNQFVVYAEHDVIPNKDAKCGAEEFHKHKSDHSQVDLPANATKAIGECFDVEMAIASDWSMFQKYLTVTAVENHNIGVLNNVQTNYDDEFADELNFVIVTQFVSDCATCDPWTTSTTAGTYLSNFRSWGNGGGFGVTYDLASLWTDINVSGGVVGVAYLSGVCNNNRYNLLEDFTTTAWALRVLTSHEFGHNFSSGHDDAGSGFIMAPSVNNTTVWSANSISSINNFVNGLNCLANCALPAPPAPGFVANIQNICEGSSVQFFDETSGVVNSRLWTFTGGVPATSTDLNPIVTYPNAGFYPVTLVATNTVGSNTLTQSGFIIVGPGGTNVLLYDSFEGGLGNWTIENPNGNITWQEINVGGTVIGSSAAYMNNWALNGVGQRDGLISQTMDFTGYTSVNLNMDYAYALWSGNTNVVDSLIIKISTDGGATFPNTVFEGGDNGTGNFATTQPQGQLNPASLSDWCYGGTYGASCLSVDLSSFIGQTNVVMKIENVNDYGNNMYIDNVMISSDCQVVAPPASDFTVSQNSGCVPLTVQFNDQSQNSPSSWNWSFPGGIPNTSTQQNPTVTYAAAGNYDVTLVVTNSAGSDTEFKSNYIQVDDVPTAAFTSIVTGLQVAFINNSIGGTTYNWTFGDGNGSTEVNPVHNYATGGDYDVTLVVTNACGVNTLMETVTIQVAPVAGFTAQTTSGCAPLTVQFTDQSTGATSWDWVFNGGNPATSTDQNPSVTFDNPGTYSVTLTVTNSVGTNSITQTDLIVVEASPSAGFSQTTNGLSVDFTNTSTNANSYSWDFGDGSNASTETNPNYTYAMDGTYTVVLSATNNCGTVTSTQTVTITTAPTAGFGANTQFGCAPLTVQFNDQSSTNATGWNWIFNGGNPSTSTQQNPTVTYDNEGIYSVTLQVTNAAGDNTITQTDFIVVDDVPVAGFSQTTNGMSVDFTNTSMNANSYSWDFGDGSNASTETNPNYTYAMDGTYNVVLTATNNCGTVTTNQSVTISSAPTAGFSSNVTSGCAPLVVQFTDQSSANATGWNWTFNGGNPSTSTQQNPTVTYDNAGTYSVTLQVTNGAGENTITQTDLIVVDDVPVAGFSQTTNGMSVDFTNTSTNANSYSWDFGDGSNASTETNPNYTYAMDGTYNVVLTATNNCGTVTTNQTVTISTLPAAGFSSNVTSGCASLVVQFTDQSSANATGWNWSFPGGTPATSNQQNPSVTYSNAGTFSVTLQVTNGAGENTVTQTDLIIVDDVPVVGFSQTTNGMSVDFTNTSTNANSYSWDFGDGSNASTETNPNYTYAMDGTYNVILTATNNCGTVTTSQTVLIANTPTAGFGVNVSSGCAPLTVQFTDQSSTNTSGWNWSFPGGTPATSTQQNPTVTYNVAGTYSATLVAMNSVGESTVTQTDLIVVDDVPVAGFTQSTNGLSVDFTNTSTNANSYSWDFGDGSNASTDQDPTHTYAMDGTYNVVLTATNNCGMEMTMITVTVLTLPTAGFSANGTSGCAPLTVQFTDQSSANATGWSWSFSGGNPATSTAQNPSVTYNVAGTYGVTLTVTNGAGESTIEEMNYVVVDDVPAAGFSSDVNSYDVDFTNTTTNGTSYSWDFGDGSNASTLENPTHTYTDDGQYTVTLTATNNCGTVTTTQTVNIANTPTANYTSGPTTGCTPFDIQFTNQSSSNATSWAWTFEGGTPATTNVENPLVTYNSAGVYSVTLIATNSVGMDTMTLTNYVTTNSSPSANFTSNVNGPMVDFTNSSSNATTYSWDFGDGSNPSTEQNPSHQYGLNGNYTVVLSATNDCGTTTFTQVVSVTSSVIAGFTSSLVSGCLPLEVQFNNQSTNATSYAWTFTGGSPATSTLENPTVTYNNAGVYTVMLEAINATGSSTIVETGYIVVGSQPTAGFTNNVNGFTVDFSNASSFGDTYSWDFGDGGMSNEESPQHTYAGIGVYPVTLTVTNDCGTTETTINVDVGTIVSAGFSAEDVEGCTPFTVQFLDESSNNVDTWNWTFDGGSPATSTEQNPVVTFNNSGVYSVTLEVSNPWDNGTFTQTNYITVFDQPIASFTSSSNGPTVDFTNTSSGTSYLWTFGDGTTSMMENPSHTFPGDGNYMVTLEVTNLCGTVSTQEMISISTAVTAGFSANVTEGCTGLMVQFTDASSANVTSWNWSFPGGTPSTSTLENPIVTYNTAGVYTVTLEASNGGFSATETETSYITIAAPPTASFTSTSTIPGVVDFTNSSTNATSYSWSFGDGGVSVEENPTHTYTMDGTYTVVLTTTNVCGTSTTEFDVVIALPPVAAFSVENLIDCAPATIQFLDESSDNTTSWFWTFEGGSPSTSTVENPAITFNTPGTHTITLEVSNSVGSSTSTLEITLLGTPVVDFSSSVNVLTTSFTNLTTDATSYFWDFGDGGSSVEENPIYTYPQGGNYTVILTATNACGTTTFTQQVEVVGPQAVASFTSLNNQGCIPFSVEFEDTSTGNPTAWAWEFPGGSPTTSTDENPIVIYNTPGSYDVTLTVTNPAGDNATTQTNYVVVDEGPTADFTSSIDVNGMVTFTNLSTNGNSYEWIFGDGGMSVEESPNHTYSETGTYTIQLTVTNDCGTDIFTQEIFVDITSIDELDFLEKLELYPNPNNGQFILNIEGDPQNKLEIRLFNLLGQEIFMENVNFNSGKYLRTYDFQELPSASYILQIKSENKLAHRKVVKE